ncbi:PAS domain S-box-containing protein/diguanylate cyclase (GGDEF) domain-containing protein [Aidingimonas halophila]|uniref:PAS domain S-box-containing protein/diguanylate cyclase (GGDEF) domain-containing protein n=1 Tax=Aidingimonas halophila TaxID=574349 RepID=A0A1H2RL34_9GAMM|nr:PAS domain S-box-containing protein/diguanylate cyclase (GGDEF) domain-containing protein [Aidingimonas halophila]
MLDTLDIAVSIANGEDSECPLVHVNRAFETLTGYRRQEILGRSCRLLQPQSVDQHAIDIIRRAIRQHRPVTVTLETRRKDGSLFWNELSLSSFTDIRGHHYLIGIQRDISERVRAHRQMELTEAVFRNTHDGILVTDADKNIIDINPAFTDLTGYTRHEVLGHKPSLLSSGKHDRAFYQHMFATVAEQGYWSGDIWNTRKDGSQLIENATISAIHDDQGQVINYVAVFRDITQRRLNQSRLERLASYDPLTGLFNREHFSILLERQLENLEFTRTGLAILFLDLDDFKPINDTYGHASGDELLIEISRRLKRLMRSNDLTARFGGDEFVIALTGLGTADKAAKVSGKILDDITAPFALDNGDAVQVSVSIGITFTNDHQVGAAALIDAADSAMYDAKQQGKNCIAHAPTVHTIDTSQDVYQQVKQAFDTGQIELFFQPILNLDNGRIVGAEALARWRHPTQGILGPRHFMHLITHSSLSLPYGEWLIEEAGRVAARCHLAHHPLYIGINLSQDHIETGTFLDTLAATYQRHAFQAPFLSLEVLESTHFHDLDLAANLLQEARELGAMIALDDFGSGISSITYASQLPLSTVKVDRIATCYVETRRDRHQFLSGIVAMSHAMQRQVLAEGVESAGQLNALRTLGCDLAQGFHIAPPMPESEFMARYVLSSDAGTTS